MSLRPQTLARNVFSHESHGDILDPYHTRNASTNAYVLKSKPIVHTHSNEKKRQSGWALNNNAESAGTPKLSKRTTPFRTNYEFSFKSSKDSYGNRKADIGGGQQKNGFTRNNKVRTPGKLLVKEPTTRESYKSPVPAVRKMRALTSVTHLGGSSGFVQNFPDLQHAPVAPKLEPVHQKHPLKRNELKKSNIVEYEVRGSRPDLFQTSYKRGFGTEDVKAVDVEVQFDIEGFTIPPGSASQRKFREWLLADLCNILEEDQDRFKIHDIIPSAHTVVQFTILPRIEEAQKSSVEIGTRLQDMVGNEKSPIFKGSVTRCILSSTFKLHVFSPDDPVFRTLVSAASPTSGYIRDPQFKESVYVSPPTERAQKTDISIQKEKHRDPTHYLHLQAGSSAFVTNNKLWHPSFGSQNQKVMDKDDAFRAEKCQDQANNRTSTMKWSGFGLEKSSNQAKQTAFTQNFHLETTQYHVGASGPRKTLKGLVNLRTTHEGLYERPKDYNRRVRSEVLQEDADNVAATDRYTSSYKRDQVTFKPQASLSKPAKIKMHSKSAFQAAQSLAAPWNSGNAGQRQQSYVSPKVQAILKYTDPVGCRDPHAHKRRGQ